MTEYFQGVESNGVPNLKTTPLPNPIIAKKPIFKQKSLTGGGSVKAGSPSFTNAPISRFIAYKNCCPPSRVCDQNYIFEFENYSTATPSALFYSNGAITVPVGKQTNTSCNNDIVLVGFYPSGLAGIPDGNNIAVLTGLNTNFSILLVTNTATGVNYTYNVSDANYPGVQAGGNLSIYKLYYWIGNDPPNFTIPTTPGTYKLTLI